MYQNKIIRISLPNLFFIVLYLSIPFINLMGTIDELGPQWFFLSLLNFVTCFYLLLTWNKIKLLPKDLIGNKLFIVYLSFLLWSLLSIFYSINVTETYLNLSRLVSTFIAFINISILMSNKKLDIKSISIVVASILLIQSIYDLKIFIDGMYSMNLDALILSIKENTGNKNILAANLAIKVPFCIYLLFSSKTYLKVLSSFALFFSFTIIIILNARASLIELFITTLLFLIYLLKTYFTNRPEKVTLLKTFFVFIIPVFFAILISQVLLKNAIEYNKTTLKVDNGYGTITKRIGLINAKAEENSRIALWKDAVLFIRDNPILGCGIGNWKITSVIYSKFRDNDFIVPYHSHNDFLETMTETGIIGGFAYISIFLISGYVLLIILFKSKQQEKVFIAFIALMCLSTYVLDASLNFPMERPPMQTMFAFLFAIILNISNYDKSEIIKENIPQKKLENSQKIIENNAFAKYYPLLFLLITLPTMYYTYSHYQSLKIQKILYFSERKNNLTNDELDSIVTENKPVPNLNYSAIPIDITLANNYLKNGNYERAIYLLERGKNDNPYLGIYEFNKGLLFFKQNNIDSGNKYFKIAFDKRPRSIDTYRNFIVSSSQKKDTSSINKAFKLFTKYRNEPNAWQMYFSTMIQALGKGNDDLIKLSDSAIKQFPDSAFSLRNLKNYMIQTMNSSSNVSNKVVPLNNVIKGPDANIIVAKINNLKQEGINLFNQKKYKDAIDTYLQLMKLQPNDYSYIENVGICYYILNDFKNANVYFNKVIKTGFAKDGKSEFYNAISLFQLNQKEDGCNMLNDAQKKNYDIKMINQYKQIYCK